MSVVGNHYGLRDAGRTWYTAFKAFLLDELGATQSCIDVCLFFIQREDNEWGIIVLWVDDTLSLMTELLGRWYQSQLATRFGESVESQASTADGDSLITDVCSIRFT